MSERCDCNLSRPLGRLFPELRLKAFGEHEGDDDRSEDFDLVSLTVLERASLISIWGRPTSRAAINIESGFEGFGIAESCCTATDVQRHVVVCVKTPSAVAAS